MSGNAGSMQTGMLFLFNMTRAYILFFSIEPTTSTFAFLYTYDSLIVEIYCQIKEIMFYYML